MPYDTTYQFEETTEQHAARLGRSVRWTKIRRRALLLKLDGLTPQQVLQRMGVSNCPAGLAHAEVDSLFSLLLVRASGEPGTSMLTMDLEAGSPHPTLLEIGGQIIGGHYGRQGDKEALARAGVMVGHPAYGYRRNGTQVVAVAGQPRRVPRIAVQPAEEPQLLFLFERYPAGWSFLEIAQELDCRDVPTRSGRPWSPDALRDMLRSPLYAGFILYRGAKDRNRRDAGTLYQGLHPPIISWKTFCEAQDARVQRAAQSSQPFWQCPWENAATRK